MISRESIYLSPMRVIASSSDQFHELNGRHSPTAFSSYILGKLLTTTATKTTQTINSCKARRDIRASCKRPTTPPVKYCSLLKVNWWPRIIGKVNLLNLIEKERREGRGRGRRKRGSEGEKERKESRAQEAKFIFIAPWCVVACSRKLPKKVSPLFFRSEYVRQNGLTETLLPPT